MSKLSKQFWNAVKNVTKQCSNMTTNMDDTQGAGNISYMVANKYSDLYKSVSYMTNMTW